MTTRPKRPRDPAQLAKLMVDIATGEVEDRAPTPEEQGKNPARVAAGRLGGVARARSLNRDQKVAIAKQGGNATAAVRLDAEQKTE